MSMISFAALSQGKTESYIIVTFEYDRTKDNHPSRDYYWILPIESIKSSNDYNLYPLYFDEFSNEDLEECKEQKAINIFTMHKGEDFILDKSLSDEIGVLKEIVQSHKTKVQTIVKKWKVGYKEKITVYITPISGNFCSSNIADYSGKDIDYEGVIYLPLSDFKLNNDFFKSDKVKLVETLDFFKNRFYNRL